MIKQKKNFLSIVVLMILSPPVFLIFYDITFTFIPLSQGDGYLPPVMIAYMATLDFCFFLLLFWFYRFILSRLNNSTPLLNEPQNGLSNTVYLFLLVASIYLFLFLVHHVFNSYNILNVLTQNQTFYTKSRRGGSWVYFFLNAFVFIALFDFYLKGFSKYKIFIFFCLVIVNAAAGSRGNIITYFFCFILIYGVVWQGKRLFSTGLFVVIFVLTTFIYNTLSRSGSTDVDEYRSSSASSADFNQAHAISDSLSYWDKEGGCYTCFAQDLSTFFIPRYFYPDKPMSNAETREVYPKVAAIGSTWTFGIYGGSIIGMGLFAFIFIPVFYLYYSYFYFKALTSRKKSFLKFSMIYLGANAVQFVRGGVVDIRMIRLMLTLILVYVIFIFLKKTLNRLKLKLSSI